MKELQMILEFLLELAGNNKMGMACFLWLFTCVGLIILFLLVVQVMNIISTTQKHLRFSKEMRLKRSIYHRFADIADSARTREQYELATQVMTECALVLFGVENEKITGDKKYDAEYEPEFSRIEEPVSRESRESSDRISDGSQKSFAKVTD